MLVHPRINGEIAFDSTVESQQFRSHRCLILAFGSTLHGTPTPSALTGPIRLSGWFRRRHLHAELFLLVVKTVSIRVL
jgi:hypothetical protein